MQRLYDKLQTFSDHFFFVKSTLYAGYSRQKVNILRTITVNSAVCCLCCLQTPKKDLKGISVNLESIFLEIKIWKENNGVARTLKKLHTSKGDYWIEQFSFFNCVPFQYGNFS